MAIRTLRNRATNAVNAPESGVAILVVLAESSGALRGLRRCRCLDTVPFRPAHIPGRALVNDAANVVGAESACATEIVVATILSEIQRLVTLPLQIADGAGLAFGTTANLATHTIDTHSSQTLDVIGAGVTFAFEGHTFTFPPRHCAGVIGRADLFTTDPVDALLAFAVLVIHAGLSRFRRLCRHVDEDLYLRERARSDDHV
jgi:hypothetical protein